MAQTYLVIGGGTAGCVIASRLSEDPGKRVILLDKPKVIEAANRDDLHGPGSRVLRLRAEPVVDFPQGYLLAAGTPKFNKKVHRSVDTLEIAKFDGMYRVSKRLFVDYDVGAVPLARRKHASGTAPAS